MADFNIVDDTAARDEDGPDDVRVVAQQGAPLAYATPPRRSRSGPALPAPSRRYPDILSAASWGKLLALACTVAGAIQVAGAVWIGYRMIHEAPEGDVGNFSRAIGTFILFSGCLNGILVLGFGALLRIQATTAYAARDTAINIHAR